ncbi:MAG TPA: PAS domain S-box protein, partial [Sphingomicrobium sp.]
MADKGGNNRSKARAAAELPRAPLAGSSFDALVTALGGGMLDFQSMLAIADILPVLTAYVDREFVYRFVNKPYAEWLEIPRKQILGRSMEQVLGSDLFALRRPMLDAAMAGERKFFVADFEHPTRGPLALQIDYVPWADATGDVRGVIIVLQDMTEHRAAERALKESEARFRQLANSAPAMMWVTRLDGKRDFVNDAYAEFSGLTREEAQTADWTEALHPDDRERVLSGGGALLEQGKPISFEARFRRHDGEWRWLRSVSQPRYGTDGEIVGYIGVASDITLAKEAELELRRQVEERTRDLALSEARFRAVFDTVLEVLVLMEPDGTVVELNRKQTSWRPEIPRELIGRKVWEGPTFQLFPDYVPLMKKAVKTAAKGKVFEQEVRLEREGVPNAHLDVSVQPVRDGDGNIIYLLFEARDITELKAAQEQLRQSQKMEALGQLTGGIAHDFNNLLTVIVGGLDIIARRADDAKLKRYAENALGAAERGARLTGQLLAFSRVQRLEVRPTYVAPLIENMRPLLRNVLGPGISKTFDL